MANVLGELFGDIANAIRSKTGGTDTMKPSDFPDNILSISTESEAIPASVKFASGSFKSNLDKTPKTVEHNLGLTPDFILVQIADSASLTDNSGFILIARGLSNALKSVSSGDSSYIRQVTIKNTVGELYSMVSDSGIEVSTTSDNVVGYIRSANSETFVVGGISWYLLPETSYNWLAISIKT